MKLTLATISALFVSYASAECNNMCSGHGTCGSNDMCVCYRNWRGNDCSEQTCQFGVAFVDTPQGDLDHDGSISQKTDPSPASGTVILKTSTTAATVNGDGTFYIDYVDTAGVRWRSTLVTAKATAADLKTEIEAKTFAVVGSPISGYSNPDWTAITATCQLNPQGEAANTIKCSLALTDATSASIADVEGLFSISTPVTVANGFAVTIARGVTSFTNLVVTQWSRIGTHESQPNFASQEAHGYMECSNKGLCDRSSGECVCFDGYEGSACQRTVCPNSCSGNGVCRNIVDLTNSLSSSASQTYPLWDGLKNQACVCDPGFSGVDCSLRLCPVNADPLIDSKVYEQQSLAITGTPSVYFTFTDKFGETWTTKTFTLTATAATNAALIKSALDTVPNGALENSSVSCSSATACTITFAQAGDLSSLVSSSGAVVVSEAVKGTNVQEECSSRGLCQYDTGLCKCFRGYRTDDCHLQHALAY